MRGLIRLLSLISLSGSLVLSESSHTPNSPGEPDAGASLNQLVEEVFSIKQSVCRNCLIAIGEFSDAGGNTENVRMTNVIRQMLIVISNNAFGGDEIPKSQNLSQCNALMKLFLGTQLRWELKKKKSDRKLIRTVPDDLRTRLLTQYITVFDDEAGTSCDAEYDELQRGAT